MSSKNQKNDSLLPVYLIAGDDELKQRRVLDRLHKRLEKMGDLSFNSEYFSGEVTSGEEIVVACNTLPFASSVRLVQVDNADRLKKSDIDIILDYLKNPCSTTVLALVAQSITKNSRLYKAVVAIDKTSFISCAPIARKDFNAAVRSMAVTHGITFTQGAAAALIDLVGTNTVALDENIKKLSLSHRGADPVNENEIYASIARTSTVKPWEFVNAFSSRNFNRCLILLKRLDKASPYQLLGMCVTRIRELLIVKSYERRGEGSSLPTVLKIPDWRVRNLKGFAENFTSKELIKALKLARDTEQYMKSGKNPDTAFLEWLIMVQK